MANALAERVHEIETAILNAETRAEAFAILGRVPDSVSTWDLSALRRMVDRYFPAEG